MSAKKHTKTTGLKAARKPQAKPASPIKKKSVKRAPAAKPGTTSRAPIDALVRELATLRATVEKQLVAPSATSPMDEVNAIRRVLTDILENRSILFLQKLASIRQVVPLSSRDILDRIDALMEDMGAITFDAERLEHLDPVIHSVGREVSDPQLPDGVIVETLHPGCRTARGQVLTKARVSINRRD
jgi:hypothetical protein